MSKNRQEAKVYKILDGSGRRLAVKNNQQIGPYLTGRIIGTGQLCSVPLTRLEEEVKE